MLLPIRHSGKGKALQVLKRSGIARSLVEGEEKEGRISGAQGSLGS